MVEKWDAVLGPRDLPDPRDPQYPQDLWTLEPQDLWEITSNVWNSEMRVPSEVILFVELLAMIIRSQSPLLLPSSYVIVINKNDDQRHLIGYIWIEKISQFLTL